MERKRTNPRDGWEQKIAEAGLIFDQAGGQPYWQEEAYYEFSAREVDDLEEATNTLHDLCLEAAAQVIERRPPGGAGHSGPRRRGHQGILAPGALLYPLRPLRPGL